MTMQFETVSIAGDIPGVVNVKARLRDKTETKSALETQIGGGHYKGMKIQPMEYSMANDLDACQHTIIKYVSRFRSKGGIQDLEKAKHCIDMLIEFELRGQSSSVVGPDEA